MSLGIFFAFLCTICWLGFDLTRKELGKGYGVILLTTWVMLGQLPFFALGMILEPWAFEWELYWLPGLLAAVINLFANVFFIWGVREAPFSVSIPLLSFTPAFSTLFGFFILGETLSALQLMGVFLIVFGGGLLSHQAWRHLDDGYPHLKRGLVLMLAVSVCWAIVPVFDKQAIQVASLTLHAFIQCLMIAAGLFVFGKFRKLTFMGRSSPVYSKVFWFGIVSAVLALYFQLRSVQLIEVGLMESIKRGLELAGSIGVGYWVFKESVNREKIFAAVLLLAGVFLVLH